MNTSFNATEFFAKLALLNDSQLTLALRTIKEVELSFQHADYMLITVGVRFTTRTKVMRELNKKYYDVKYSLQANYLPIVNYIHHQLFDYYLTQCDEKPYEGQPYWNIKRNDWRNWDDYATMPDVFTPDMFYAYFDLPVRECLEKLKDVYQSEEK